LDFNEKLYVCILTRKKSFYENNGIKKRKNKNVVLLALKILFYTKKLKENLKYFYVGFRVYN